MALTPRRRSDALRALMNETGIMQSGPERPGIYPFDFADQPGSVEFIMRKNGRLLLTRTIVRKAPPPSQKRRESRIARQLDLSPQVLFDCEAEVGSGGWSPYRALNLELIAMGYLYSPVQEARPAARVEISRYNTIFIPRSHGIRDREMLRFVETHARYIVMPEMNEPFDRVIIDMTREVPEPELQERLATFLKGARGLNPVPR